MFSTQTAPPPAGSKAIAANALRSAGLIDKDATMRDVGDRPGGRKGVSKHRSHRTRPIDAFKDQRAGTSGPRTLTAGRISSSDSHAGPSDPLAIRGAARPTVAGRMRRNAVSSSAAVTVSSGGRSVGRAAKQIEAWKEVVRSRWNSDIQFLNLESLIDDDIVKKHNLTPPGVGGGSAREAGVIFKVAGELKPPVKTLSLANNRLNGDHLQYLSKFLPKLANLSLAGNNLRQFKDLDVLSARREKLIHLRELLLTDNPLREQEYKNGRADRYKHELTRRFPSLEVLDSEPVAQISFDVPQSTSTATPVKKPDATTFPHDMAGSFIAGVEPSLVSNFCVRFFEFFDNQREGLINVYDPQASFSFSVNTSIPERARIQGLLFSKDLPNQRELKWGPWLGAGSRNLNRLGGLEKHVKSLLMGSDSIIPTLQKLPGTKHDITGPAERFCLDAFPVPIGANMGLLVSIHGQFTEMPVNGVRSFDRTFVLAAAPEGSRAKANGWDVVILSDQWTVRAYSSSDAWKPGRLHVQADRAEAGRPAPAQTSANTWVEALPAKERDALATLAEPQRSQVIEVMRRTNLNVEFAYQCLANNEWNFDRALANFEQVKASLSRDAYV